MVEQSSAQRKLGLSSRFRSDPSAVGQAAGGFCDNAAAPQISGRSSRLRGRRQCRGEAGATHRRWRGLGGRWSGGNARGDGKEWRKGKSVAWIPGRAEEGPVCDLGACSSVRCQTTSLPAGRPSGAESKSSGRAVGVRTLTSFPGFGPPSRFHLSADHHLCSASSASPHGAQQG